MIDEVITSMGEHLVYISSLTEDAYAALCASPYSLPAPAAAALGLLTGPNAYFHDYALGLARCPLRFDDFEAQLNVMVVRCINEAWHLGIMSAEDYNTIQACLVRSREAKALLDPEAMEAYRESASDGVGEAEESVGPENAGGAGESTDIVGTMGMGGTGKAGMAAELSRAEAPPCVGVQPHGNQEADPLGLPPMVPLAPGDALSIDVPTGPEGPECAL